MKARLLYHHKAKVMKYYILELMIHDVGKSERYKDGIKYGLICIDERTGNKVLMDNHHPKGHHVHLGDEEIAYQFVSIDKLIEDFEIFVFNYLGVKL